MASYLALFSAVNVGGRNKLPMAELKELCRQFPITDVSTYLQTGNLVFTAVNPPDHQFITALQQSIEQRFGFVCSIFIRNADEMQQLVANNPFTTQPQIDPKQLLLVFLQQAPSAQQFSALQQAVKGEEQLFLWGNSLYISYHPLGIGKSKLTNKVIEKHLAVECTGRNWNTVCKLTQMLTS